MAAFNLNNSWGQREVSALLGSVQDDRNWQLIIKKNGEVSLHDMGLPLDHSKLHGRCEGYMRGNMYVGAEAAQDQPWLETVEGTLRRNWPVLEHDEYIDH